MVADIQVGAGSSSPGNAVTLASELFFRANDGSTGNELWKSDGTAAGTTLVKDVNVGAGSGFNFAITTFDGLVYFAGTKASTRSSGAATARIRARSG